MSTTITTIFRPEMKASKCRNPEQWEAELSAKKRPNTRLQDELTLRWGFFSPLLVLALFVDFILTGCLGRDRWFTRVILTGVPRLPVRYSNFWFRYGVVPKGLLTFLGSLYKEVAKSTSRTLVYRFERQTARKKILPSKNHCVLDLECRILSQEPSDSCILYFNVIFHGK